MLGNILGLHLLTSKRNIIIIYILICSFGFIKEIRPSEPYLTQYLLGPWVNLTKTEINHQVYPWWTYSSLVWQVLVFLATDWLRYQPVIVIGALCYVTTWILLLWTRTVGSMQVMQIVYGLATSTDVAYYTYLYTMLPEGHFKRATSFLRAAHLFGKFLSGSLSQLLVSTNSMDFRELNFISLGSVITALFITFFLPRPSTSLFFHPGQQDNIAEQSQDKEDKAQDSPQTKQSTWVHIWSEIRQTLRNPRIVKWSIWWAVATAGFLQIGNYIQPLWEEIDKTWNNGAQTGARYNGAVESAQTFLGTLSALAAGAIPLAWDRVGEPVLAILSLIQAAILLAMANAKSLWPMGYLGYIGFSITYHALITIISYQVAQELTHRKYSLVFGINYFFATLIQFTLTLILLDNSVGIMVSPRQLFTILGTGFGGLGVVFMVFSLVSLLLWWKRNHYQGIVATSAPA